MSQEPNKLRPSPKIRPLDPDKPLMPTQAPSLKRFDRDMPGQLTLEDMDVIERAEDQE